LSERRLVLHHFDPLVPGLGGIDTCIRGLVRFAQIPSFAFVGTDTSDEAPRGRWVRREVAGTRRAAAICYVASSGGTRERIPNGLRLGAGASRHARTIRRTLPRYLASQKRAATAADRMVSFSPTAAERLAGLHDDVRSLATWFDPERFPRTLVEMLASGRPVVATPGADTGRRILA
jgi:hypothetical protein